MSENETKTRWKYVITLLKKMDDETHKPKVVFSNAITENGDGTVTISLTRKADGSEYKRITTPKAEIDVEENVF